VRELVGSRTVRPLKEKGPFAQLLGATVPPPSRASNHCLSRYLSLSTKPSVTADPGAL